MQAKRATFIVNVTPPDATVTVTGNGATLTGTGVHRTVSIENPTGDYSLVASFDGFVPATVKLAPVPGRTESLDVRLDRIAGGEVHDHAGWTYLVSDMNQFRTHWKSGDNRGNCYFDADAKSIVIDSPYDLGTVVSHANWTEFRFTVAIDRLSFGNFDLLINNLTLKIGSALSAPSAPVVVSVKFYADKSLAVARVGDRIASRATVLNDKWGGTLSCKFNSGGGQNAKIRLSDLRVRMSQKNDGDGNDTVHSPTLGEGAIPVANTDNADNSDHDWEKLFDGKTLNGWKADPRSQHAIAWTAKNGELVPVTGIKEPIKKHIDLLTVGEFHDFEFRCEFWLDAQSNSGVFLRGRYEVQLLDDANAHGMEPSQKCGAIYGMIGRQNRHITVRESGINYSCDSKDER